MNFPLKDLVESFLYNRHPLKVAIGFEALPKPHVSVEIKNQTPAFTAHVHSVRVHYGMKERNLSFVLFPFSKVSLAPKDRAIWKLEYEPAKSKIQKFTEMDRPPPYPPDNDGPGIDSPASLFNAIGMGKKEDSWIEVDFNEYDKRIFKRGDVKEIFDAVGKATRELRKINTA